MVWTRKQKKFVEKCIEHNVFTNKKTKELIQPHITSQNCWKKGFADLFGTRPSSGHIVLKQYLKSRFLASNYQYLPMLTKLPRNLTFWQWENTETQEFSFLTMGGPLIVRK